MGTITQTATVSIPRGPVTSEMVYYTAPEDGSEPYNYVENPPSGVPAINYGGETHLVTISDLRGEESKFNLDNNAFQVIQGVQSQETDFSDDEHIRSVYYPEVEKLILDNVPGANRVFIFDHTIRRSTKDPYRGPVYRVHIDQTAKAARNRLRFHLPDEADSLLQGRHRIINIWRPINGPVFGNSLGLANSSTVPDEDMVAVKYIYPDRNGETAAVKYNPKHEWHYLSGMTNDERLLIKCFDSDEKFGKWGRVPHSAFKDSRTPIEAPSRESIEVRTLVFG